MEPTATATATTPQIYNSSIAISYVPGETGPGSTFGPYIWSQLDLLADLFSQHGVGPVVAWGDFAMGYYGVPSGITLIHILIDDSQLDTAYKALIDAGHVDVTYDVNRFTDWNELGARFFQFVVRRPGDPKKGSTFFIQGFSVCKPYLTISKARTFPVVHGLSMPPLQTLAESFVVTTFNFPDRYTLTCELFKVWRWYLMKYGYTPLSDDAIQPSEEIDEGMVSYWRTGELDSNA